MIFRSIVFLPNKVVLVLCSLLFVCTSFELAQAQPTEKFNNTQIFDGSENVLSFGVDSTKNWWIITSPYETFVRLHVNGFSTEVYNAISNLTFSHDGENWACFALVNNQWFFLHNGAPTQIQCTKVGSIVFSPNSETVAYTYTNADQEIIQVGNKRTIVNGATLGFVVNQNGSKFSCVVRNGSGVSVWSNGKLGEVFDEIRLLGYWYTNELVYSARSGDQWRVYKNESEFLGVFRNISEQTINIFGTVAAFVVSNGNTANSIVVSDDYTEPLYGKSYSSIQGLRLHPNLPLCAYMATFNATQQVVLSGAEYATGTEFNTLPKFSHDGTELLFFGCNNNCFASINGRQYTLAADVDASVTYAKRPGELTFAHSTGTSLVLRNIENAKLWVSKMCDEVTLPRYNWRTEHYEALGRISNRIYLLQGKK